MKRSNSDIRKSTSHLGVEKLNYYEKVTEVNRLVKEARRISAQHHLRNNDYMEVDEYASGDTLDGFQDKLNLATYSYTIGDGYNKWVITSDKHCLLGIELGEKFTDMTAIEYTSYYFMQNGKYCYPDTVITPGDVKIQFCLKGGMENDTDDKPPKLEGELSDESDGENDSELNLKTYDELCQYILNLSKESGYVIRYSGEIISTAGSFIQHNWDSECEDDDQQKRLTTFFSKKVIPLLKLSVELSKLNDTYKFDQSLFKQTLPEGFQKTVENVGKTWLEQHAKVKLDKSKKAHKLDAVNQIKGAPADSLLPELYEQPKIINNNFNKLIYGDDKDPFTGPNEIVGSGILSENPNDPNFDEGGIKEEKESTKEKLIENMLGWLQFGPYLKPGLKYVYEYYRTSTIIADLQQNGLGACLGQLFLGIFKLTAAGPIYIQLFKILNAFKESKLTFLHLAKLVMAFWYFFTVLSMYGKVTKRHDIVVTSIDTIEPLPNDCRREMDTNFEKTKLETIVTYTEKVSDVLNLSILNFSYPIITRSSIKEKYASAELISNLIDPIVMNPTVSPTSILEKIAKSTNKMSYIDYDRATMFEQDIVENASTFASAVCFHHRCRGLSTNVYDAVFRREGESMILCETYSQRVPLYKRIFDKVKPHVQAFYAWMGNKSPNIKDTITMVIAPLTSALSLFPCRIILPIALLNLICFINQKYGLLCLIQKFALIFPRFLLDQIPLILIACYRG